jgi:hypothetical protein
VVLVVIYDESKKGPEWRFPWFFYEDGVIHTEHDIDDVTSMGLKRLKIINKKMVL